MQLTRHTDYSLRLLIYLGLHPDRLATIPEVASYYRISRNHLMKITHRLALHGYIETLRGKRGGMRLARRPGMINIGDVVRDMEESFHVAECFNPDNKTCPLLPACNLKFVLGRALKEFLGTLDAYTLADLLSPSKSSPHGELLLRARQ